MNARKAGGEESSIFTWAQSDFLNQETSKGKSV